MDTAEVAASLRARSRPPSRRIGDPRRLVTTTTTTTLINGGRVTGQRHREPFAIHVGGQMRVPEGPIRVDRVVEAA
jgi:hypothetical protein